MQPQWLPDSFAAVMIAVSVYCSARLLSSRRLRRRINIDINIAHVTMGVAMAGMLVPALTTLPTGVWEVFFVGLAAWFSRQSVLFIARHRGRSSQHDLHHVSHYLTHLVMSCAMLYMYFATPTGTAAAGSGAMSMGGASGTTADFVGLPLFFLVVLGASAVWHVDSLSPSPANEAALVGAGLHVPGQTTGAAPLPVSATAGTRGGSGPDDRPFMAPRLEMACHIAMCITMSYMLILML